MNKMRNGRKLKFNRITLRKLAGVIGAVKTGALCNSDDCIIVHTDVCPPKKTRDMPCDSQDTCSCPTAQGCIGG